MIETEPSADPLEELHELFIQTDEETERVLQELRVRSQIYDKKTDEYLAWLEEFLHPTSEQQQE